MTEKEIIEQNAILTKYFNLETRIDELSVAIEAIQKRLDKIPEFREWWAKYNCCGYQD